MYAASHEISNEAEIDCTFRRSYEFFDGHSERNEAPH
jgi:hypothetical protein